MFWIKIALSALIIAAVSELSKRFTLMAAILASLPLVSILAILWLYIETKDVQKVIALSNGIFWAVLPSLLFFAALSLLLRFNVSFFLALGSSCLIMAGGYWAYLRVLGMFGVQI